MKVEKHDDGIWLATGRGFTRPIAAEGETRREAVSAFKAIYMGQMIQAGRAV